MSNSQPFCSFTVFESEQAFLTHTATHTNSNIFGMGQYFQPKPLHLTDVPNQFSTVSTAETLKATEEAENARDQSKQNALLPSVWQKHQPERVSGMGFPYRIEGQRRDYAVPVSETLQTNTTPETPPTDSTLDTPPTDAEAIDVKPDIIFSFAVPGGNRAKLMQ